MMNEKCAGCIHCEVCGFIESEVAKEGACAFYEDGKKWELTKEEKALLQKWRDNRGISMKDFEDAMDSLEQEPKTGHWIYSRAVNTGEIVFSECSVCGNGESGCALRMNYCPNCGAKMEAEE